MTRLPLFLIIAFGTSLLPSKNPPVISTFGSLSCILSINKVPTVPPDIEPLPQQKTKPALPPVIVKGPML